MDSVTQAVLGGVIGELVLGRKLGLRGMAWGVAFGTIPDLDVFLPGVEGVEGLRVHRGLTHSILVTILVPLLLARPMARFYGGRGLLVREAGWFLFLVWGTHVLVDVFTGYGTQIFEPFSDARVSLNNMSIIDLVFTLPMLICVVWWGVEVVKRLLGRGDHPGRRRFTRVMFLLSCLYAVFSFVMKGWATHRVKGYVAEDIPGGRVVAVAPTFNNTILWRAMVETEGGFFVTYWSPFDEEQAPYQFYARNAELAEDFRGKEDFETLVWFSRGDWVMREFGEDLVMIDLRFDNLRDPSKEEVAPMFQWSLRSGEDGGVKAERYGFRRADVGPTLRLLGERVFGRQDRWNALRSF